MRSRTGACRTASPAPATAPRSPASSTTRCAGARRRPSHGRRHAARRAARHAAARARARLDAIARLADGSRLCAGAADRRASVRGCARRASTARRRMCAATIPNGSIRILPRVFGEERAEEGAALASPRAARPARQHAEGRPRRGGRARSPISRPSRRAGRRRACASSSRADAKSPAIHAEPAFIKGLIEIQDEGSQLAALLAGAKPGEQVLDLCAGAGGKTLALAAAMDNHGPDLRHRRRQAPARADPRPAGARRRAQCAGAHAEIASATSSPTSKARIDLVLIDAPCTGTGAWRRNPDAKWRVRPGALAERLRSRPRRSTAPSRW